MAPAATVLVPPVLSVPELLWIPGFPFLAFVFLILRGRRAGVLGAWCAVLAMAGSFVTTLAMVRPVIWGVRLETSWRWLSARDPRWAVGFSVDGLSWFMLFLVTLIGTLIIVYSIGYMRDDPRFSRFFAYLSLFCASMLTLVLANHFVLLYVGWELVGLCSYLLISFWFEKPSAAAAGRKAFITTRIGDTGLLLGILCLAWTADSLHFDRLHDIRSALPPELLTVISLLIFLGAVGKSAQIPLHVWLPDAMEGPTPVSALIHAATMVAAGVYLVARTLPLFTPESLAVVLMIGLLTHLLTGTVALTMTDIKRVLAYSTLSQLGLMMTSLGLGASAYAMFHLGTHAFFKALLFLGAGSVIHATHEQELTRLGGLRRAMPYTAGMFLIAAIAMSGFFPLAGFWSKDAILLEAQHKAPWLFWVLLAGAGMTASYIFRLYLRVFHGASIAYEPHESPAVMLLPMAALAAGTIVSGFGGSPWLHHPVLRLLGLHETHGGLELSLLIGSTLVACAGIWLAWTVGVQHRNLLPTGLRPLGHRLYTWAAHKYYIDELYERAIVQPFIRLTQQLGQFDRVVIDRAVDSVGRFGWSVSQWKESVDRLVVDRVVNGVALTVRGIGAVLRWLQSGVVHHYLLAVVIAVVALSVAMRR